MAARALAAVGAVHEHMGDSDTAMRVLGDAADALRAERASHYEARTLVLLADITERTGGALETVRERLIRAYEIYEAGGSPEAEKLRERLDRLDGIG